MATGDPFCACGCGGWLGQCVRPPWDNWPDLPIIPEVHGPTIDPKTLERWECGLGEACFVCHPRKNAA